MLLDEIFDHAVELLEGGRQVALCILVRARGSTPASAGAVMLVDDAAGTCGSIGGGCIEAEVRRAAVSMIRSGRARVLHYVLDHDRAWEDGLICGGSIDVGVALPMDGGELRAIAERYRRREATEFTFRVLEESVEEADGKGEVEFEYALEVPPRPVLLIAGGGHIGGAVSKLANGLGFHVKVFDDRGEVLDRFIAADAEKMSGPIHEMIARETIDEATFIVIATRGHRHDARVLKAVIDRPAKYIGMIGSRRKVRVTYDDLTEEGVSAGLLERVHAPIGLDIGSVTINEIALSIVAELVKVSREGGHALVRGPERVEAGG